MNSDPEDSDNQAASSGSPERVSLPPAREGLRLRVNEIDPSSAASPAGRNALPAKEKLVFVPRERHHLSSSESNEWGAKGRHGTSRWILLAGCGTGCVVALILAIYRPGKGEAPPRHGRIEPVAAIPSGDGEDPGNLEFLANGKARAMEIFAAYASATKPEDFMAHVHAAERNRALIEKEWKPLGMSPGWSPDDGTIWSTRIQDGLGYGMLRGVLADFTAYNACFRADDGTLKLDWKATVGHGSADFSAMTDGKGDGGELRVWITPVNFHTITFPEQDYRCFKLVSAGGDAHLWGYVPRGGELDDKLNGPFLPGGITGNAKAVIQATILLEPSPGEPLPNQWLITGLVRMGWLDE